MTQKQLTEKFNEFNAKFFKGAIKNFKVVPHKPLRSRLGQCDEDKKEIQVDGTLNETETNEVLLHEMVHAYIGNEHGHDKLFNSECERIENLTGLNLRRYRLTKEEKEKRLSQTKKYRNKYYEDCRQTLLLHFERKNRGEWNRFDFYLKFFANGGSWGLTKLQIKRLLSEFSA